MIRTKICGIRNLEELRIAENSGTDAVGFLVGQKHNAKGFITNSQANYLCSMAKIFVNTVIVTHLDRTDDLINLANTIRSNYIQIHTDLSVDDFYLIKKQNLRQKIIGKVSVVNSDSIKRAKEIEEVVDAILLDTIDFENDRVGGTGQIHDWNISAQIVREVKVPVILAGGLSGLNVHEAIKMVKPWGVDANSGIRKNFLLDKSLAKKFVMESKKIDL